MRRWQPGREGVVVQAWRQEAPIAAREAAGRGSGRARRPLAEEKKKKMWLWANGSCDELLKHLPEAV